MDERRQGHKALRVSGGEIKTFDPHPPETEEPTRDAATEKPVYRKFPMDKPTPKSTQLYGISVDEGWRESIVCTYVEEWAVDWLVEQLQGKPYAPGKRP